MYKLARPLFFICETSLHAGSGNDLGIVDLPVQRERHTGFPKVEGSGIKGCIREVFEEMVPAIAASKKDFKFTGTSISKDELTKAINLVFGPEKGGDHAGALGFTDARLLLFPVKSMKGVFAWVTCPRVLERFKRDMLLCRIIDPKLEIPSENSTPSNSTLFIKDNKLVLEEYTFEINHKDDESCTNIAVWLSKNVIPSGEAHKYWREKMTHDMVVIPDDDFRDFVSLSTEVVTRTKIDSSTGTVAKGQLFTEEYLPPETVLYSLALATPLFSDNKGIFKTGKNGVKTDKPEEEEVLEFLADNLPQVIQIGGNATIGKGLAWVNMHVELSQGGAKNE